MKKNLMLAILKAGCIVGLADIILACVSAYFQNHVGPIAVLKYVAKGALGQQKAITGIPLAVVGFIIHMGIAYVFCTLFFIIYPKIKWMQHHKVLAGAVYGIAVWAIMNFVVLPFTHTPPASFHFTKAWLPAFILVISIGIPLSFLAHMFYKK